MTHDRAVSEIELPPSRGAENGTTDRSNPPARPTLFVGLYVTPVRTSALHHRTRRRAAGRFGTPGRFEPPGDRGVADRTGHRAQLHGPPTRAPGWGSVDAGRELL